MKKNIIPMPSSILFETQIPIQICHINYGNHVGYDAMVSILHEAQVRFFENYGYTEINIDGLAIVVQKLEVLYKKEVLYGETMKIQLGLGDVTKARVELLFSVLNVDLSEVSRARTTLVFVDPLLKKVARTPDFLARYIQKS